MCGIIGYYPLASEINSDTIHAFNCLWKQSVIRGRHAYGLAKAMPNGYILVGRTFEARDIPLLFNPMYPTIAHARYSQSGDWRDMANNQPIVAGSLAVAMNGVIHMGTKQEFEAAFGVTCQADNDSEVFLRRLEQGQSASAFLLEATGSIAVVWLQDGHLWAGRNERRPLWYAEEFGAIWFASTADIFHRAGFTKVSSVTPFMVQEIGR